MWLLPIALGLWLDFCYSLDFEFIRNSFRSGSDLRIIRPFVYQRERTLESFARNKDIPCRPSRLLSNSSDMNSNLLRAQEAVNPAVYENIKSALKPLLALRWVIHLIVGVFSREVLWFSPFNCRSDTSYDYLRVLQQQRKWIYGAISLFLLLFCIFSKANNNNHNFTEFNSFLCVCFI